MNEDTPRCPDDPFPASPGDVRLLLTTAPPDVAQGMARTLVEERLAACVSLLPGVRSIYRWQGAVLDDPETQLVIKTSEARLEALAARLEALHPHEVPELLVLAPTGGSKPWLDWLQAQLVEVPEES